MDPQKRKGKEKKWIFVAKTVMVRWEDFPFKLHVCTGGCCQMFFSSSSHPHLTVLFIYQICTCRLDGLRKSSSSCKCRRRGSSEVKAFLSWNAAINKTCIILAVRLRGLWNSESSKWTNFPSHQIHFLAESKAHRSLLDCSDALIKKYLPSKSTHRLLRFANA